MQESTSASGTVDEFIARFPEDVQTVLQQLRAIIHEAAPNAREVISYGMPAFKLHGILVYFGAHVHHIGFYPTSSGVSHFKDRLTPYEFSKGAIRFPIDRPLPFDLIREIVAFRVQEDMAKASASKKK